MRKMDKKSWLTGFVLGLCGKPLPIGGSKREPVAYLYNGVRLPPLPQTERCDVLGTDIGCATVLAKVYQSGKTEYTLFFTPVKLIWNNEHGGLITDASVHDRYCGVIYELRSGQWKCVLSHEENVAHDATGEEITVSWNPDIDRLIWANYDVMNGDGTVYLAASDPIPVYA